MGELFDKISKAVDAFADVITEKQTSTQVVEIYKYEDFRRYFLARRKEIPQIEKCTISVTQKKEFEETVFSENKYIIRILMLDGNGKPISFDEKEDSYVGTIVIASAIDKAMVDFMGEASEKTVGMGRR